ncbi:unnamed protein product, partial [marine sediment metagenome]
MVSLPSASDPKLWGTKYNEYLSVEHNPDGTHADGVINVKSSSIGATGDGVTDDSVAVEGALASMTDGDVLFFPSGNYLLSTYSAQTITANISIIGAGKGKTTITGPDMTTDFISTGTGGSVNIKGAGFSTFDSIIKGTTNDVDFVVVDECRVDGAKHLYDDAGFATTGDVDRFRVTNCSLSNISGVAIDFQAPTTETTHIQNNRFDT